jgi:PAS domain-containing protein
MKDVHTLLKDQLRQYFDSLESIPEEWQGFIEAVNNAYWQSDVDRTERKQAEREIQNLQRYNRGLIETSLDPLVTFD